MDGFAILDVVDGVLDVNVNLDVDMLCVVSRSKIMYDFCWMKIFRQMWQIR